MQFSGAVLEQGSLQLRNLEPPKSDYDFAPPEDLMRVEFCFDANSKFSGEYACDACRTPATTLGTLKPTSWMATSTTFEFQQANSNQIQMFWDQVHQVAACGWQKPQEDAPMSMEVLTDVEVSSVCPAVIDICLGGQSSTALLSITPDRV